MASKDDLNDNDQIIAVQNDAARRVDLSTLMAKVTERVNVPQYSIRAAFDVSNINGETLHTDKTLYAETDTITRLTFGLFVSVSVAMDYPGFHYPDRPWKLNLILSDGTVTTNTVYISDGRPATTQLLSESQIINLIYFENIETEAGTVSGWFVPNLSHIHDERYYTQDEIDEVVSDIDDELERRTLIDTDEMDDLLRRYQEYTGSSGNIGEIELPTITTPTIGETSEVATGQAMSSNDVGDMMYDIYHNL